MIIIIIKIINEWACIVIPAGKVAMSKIVHCPPVIQEHGHDLWTEHTWNGFIYWRRISCNMTGWLLSNWFYWILLVLLLDWLPITSRITYKILLLTFKTYHGFTPSYLSELLPLCTPVRTIRSASQSLLSCPQTTSYKQYGQRSFVYASTFLWNNLPLQIRNAGTVNAFKTMLKAHLFKSCSE